MILCLCLVKVQAQYTLTYADIPHPGDSFIVSVDRSHSVNIGTSGPTAQSWDFSNLVQDSIKFSTYGISSRLPFASDFPLSNLYSYGPGFIYAGPGSSGPAASAFGYLMMVSGDTGMYVLGYRSNYDGRGEKDVYHDKPEILVKTPCTYNTPTTSTFSEWQVAFNVISANYDTVYISHIEKHVSCDAFGDITIPTARHFSNVLRVHEFGVISDTIRITYGGMTVYNYSFRKDTFNYYHYYAPLQRHPVATAYTRPNGSLILVEYLKFSVLEGIENGKSENQGIRIYPNPVNDHFTVSLPGNLTEPSVLKIFDSFGRIIRSTTIPANTATYNMNSIGLQAGVYFVVLENKGEIFTTGFISDN